MARRIPARRTAPKRATASRKPGKPPASPQVPTESFLEGGEHDRDETYTITLRTRNVPDLVAKAQDRVLYPLTVAWNRVLEAHESRKPGWHATSHKAFAEFASKGELDPALIDPFIEAAAASGVVEVEMEWKREGLGWAGRLFPWEAVLSMATKPARVRLQQPAFVVVRVLLRKTGGSARKAAAAKGLPAYAPCDAGQQHPLDFAAEFDAIQTSLGKVVPLDTRTMGQLEEDVKKKKPAVIHFAANDMGEGPIVAKVAGRKPEPQPFGQIASITAAHRPELAVYSCCYSGRRLAPHAVAIGAQIALGFQGDVYDDSVPLFFGPFYLEWKKSKDILAALCAGLTAHNSQRDSEDLGGVTVWSATPLLKARVPEATSVVQDSTRKIAKRALGAAFRVDFTPHPAFNYSVLHNDRAGLFQTFTLTKKVAGVVPAVLVKVSLQTGVGSASECAFSVLPQAKAYDFTDLAQRLSLPLGAPLIRQRGESLWATLETRVTCDGVTLHEDSRPLSILPCDEWRDDDLGQHFLPSFVFPRNPAIRDIISAAQPFLRAFVDTPQAGFDGYQAAFAGRDMTPARAVEYQVRALWAALQHTLRLDYVNSAATHTKQSQRLRTPDEILRSRRGTCIELTLLLASCLEHIGIYPVLFLVPGHAFVGYWASQDYHSAFTKSSADILEKARPKEGEEVVNPEKQESVRNKRNVNWRYNARHHPKAILAEVEAGTLIAIETTSIPFQNSFKDAQGKALERLKKAVATDNPLEAFDAMLEVRLARKDNVTPLPIIVDGILA